MKRNLNLVVVRVVRLWSPVVSKAAQRIDPVAIKKRNRCSFRRDYDTPQFSCHCVIVATGYQDFLEG